MKQQLLDALPRRIYLELKHREFKLTRRAQFERMQEMRRITTDQGYSYKPFDDKRAIFVHIPKCAGVSVNKTLFGGLAGGHVSLDGYLNIFEPKSIIEYFKFTIVRNPWDRLVSAYFFLKDGGFNEDDKLWAESELGAFHDFDEFVCRWVTKDNVWKWHHFRPQHHYMLERREKISLDFVGFLENLDEDFAFIAARLGLDCTLSTVNSSNHGSYMHYYSDKTRNLVADVYSEDIRLLGYRFDNSSLEQQLASRRAGKVFSLR